MPPTGHEHGADAPRGPWPRPTALEWFALAASLLLTLQYAWILDDAYIYARYVDNLVHLGRGLVFNEGEYVEGYSSPLWCLLLAPIRAAGLNWWTAFRAIGVASALATWALLVVLARRVAPANPRPLNLAALLLCFNYAVQSYFTSGVEAPLVQLAAVAFALYVFDPRHTAAAVLVGLAPMIRHELVLPLAIAVLWAWRSRGRFPWLVCLVAAASLGPWMLFRIAYYADIFPNTFYLKDEVNWARGLRYLHDTAVTYGVYVLAPLFGLLAFALSRAGVAKEALRAKERWVLLAAAASVTLYVAKIGGDPRHYRYLAFPFCVLVCASQGLVDSALDFASERTRRFAPLLGLAIALGVFALYPRQLSSHPITRNAEHLKVGEINDAQYHRLRADLAFDPWVWDAGDEMIDDIYLDLIWRDHPLLPQGPVPIRGEYARYRAAGLTSADFDVYGESWCTSAWKRFSQALIHKDGLTEAILARAKVPSHRAAHKRALLEFAPDVIALRAKYGFRAGAAKAAASAGDAPEWIVRNLETIDTIERKIFNRHDLWENVGLVLEGRLAFDPYEGAGTDK
jgi:hypothetical protein